MQTDLVLSPFNADLRSVVEVATAVDQIGGIGGIWTFDHFSGSMVGASWSRHPFVTLGAIAAVTEHLEIGMLVANMTNRHPAQLASGINSLQSLAPGRVICGVGAGSAPGSRFAAEQTAIGRTPAGGAERSVHLIETIESLRALWRGDSYDGASVHLHSPIGVLDAHPPPPIIVGANSVKTIALAAEHADGVNIRATPALADLVAAARGHNANPDFEVSVMIDFDPEHPLGGDPDPLVELGISRRILSVPSPYPLDAIRRLAENPSLGS